MEDLMIINLLKRKGLISDNDIHDAVQDTHYSRSTEYPVVNMESSNISTDMKAKDVVSRMSHIQDGKRYVGEKYDVHKAREVCDRYRGMLPALVTVCDIYMAINYQYHSYINLFKTWFDDSELDQKMIESAMFHWFMNENYKDKIEYLRTMLGK